MGVEYARYLIPRPNSFRPTPQAAAELISALRDEGWLLRVDDPALAQLPFAQSRLYRPAQECGYFAQTVGRRDSFTAPLPDLLKQHADRDLRIVWPVESLSVSGLRYPLAHSVAGLVADDIYYEFQLHFGHNYIYRVSEVIHPFEPSPKCSCGRVLELDPESEEDPFYSQRIAARCPKCGLEFDPTNLTAAGHDGFSGTPLRIQGGATYRFALVIDCGKCFGDGSPRLHPELKTTVQDVLDIETYEVAEYY